MKEFNLQDLQDKAKNFRREILEMVHNAKSGHPGGSLSAIDILITLYFYKMNHDPSDPKSENRDRFIMSKGHASPAVYVTLANAGYFSKDELNGFRKLNCLLQGHVVADVAGVELSTGSLGQGASVAVGMALAGKLKKAEYKVYALLGDGEIQEGQVWESFMTANNYDLNNLCIILDYNKVQENGPVVEIMKEEPLTDKLLAFGFHVISIDGHDFEDIKKALDEVDTIKNKPTFIIANTIKGKGVSFMENQSKWHGKAPSDDELKI
ncbi:transketolase, partial [bacterium]